MVWGAPTLATFSPIFLLLKLLLVCMFKWFLSAFVAQGRYSETRRNLRHSKVTQEAVCPDVFAALPNVVIGQTLIIFAINYKK
jgi:hypothetical protein